MSAGSDEKLVPPPPPPPPQPPAPQPLAGEVFDAHCHLDMIAGKVGEQAGVDFRAAAVAAAAAVGVTKMINVGTRPGDWQQILESTENPAIYGAIAVHPTEVSALTDDDYVELERLLAHPKVVAVGETGLDYYWDRSTPVEQEEHFRRHLDMAKRVGKPVMIHDRDAHADVLRILAEEGAPSAGVVFHSFSGDESMARECVEAGYVLSLSGVITFRNAPALRAAAAVTPLEQLLVETDAPYLTPHPHRGKPNAPYLIPHVVRAICEVKQVDETVACATISATGHRLFGL